MINAVTFGRPMVALGTGPAGHLESCRARQDVTAKAGGAVGAAGCACGHRPMGESGANIGLSQAWKQGIPNEQGLRDEPAIAEITCSLAGTEWHSCPCA